MSQRFVCGLPLMACVVASIGGGCLDDAVKPPPVPRVARIEILAPDSEVLIGHTLQLGIQAFDSGGGNVSAPSVTWESGDPGFITVDSTGLVTATLYSLAGTFPVYATAAQPRLVDTFWVRVHLWGEVKRRVPLGVAPVLGGPAQGPDGTLYVLGEVDTVSFLAATLFAVTPQGHVKLAKVDGTNYPIVGSDGVVYVVGQYVWAFNSDGSLRWSLTARPNDIPDFHAAALSADGVLFAAMGYDLLALHAGLGDTVWVGPRAPDAGWLLPPSVSHDRHTAYIKWSAESLYAFDAATGAHRWAVADPDTIQPERISYGNGPAAFEDVLEVPTAFWLMTVDTSGVMKGVGPDIGRGVTEPVVGPDGTLYVQLPHTYGLHALRPVTTQLWQALGYRTTQTWSGGPALAQGGILDLATTGAFYSLQLLNTGVAVRWRYPKTDSLHFEGAPLIGPDGTVYTFTSCEYHIINWGPCTDELIAFWDDRPVESSSPWPMWRHDARRTGQADR